MFWMKRLKLAQCQFSGKAAQFCESIGSTMGAVVNKHAALSVVNGKQGS